MTSNSNEDLAGLSRVGRVVALALREMNAAARPGLTTAALEAVGAKVLSHFGARSAPQLVYGFPGTFCISVNDEAVHGIPGPRVLEPGDLVKIDATAEMHGYIADATITVALPPVSDLRRALRDCALAALLKGVAAARVGGVVSDIGQAVESEVKRRGFSVIHQLNGHEVGPAIHGDLTIPNYYNRRYNKPLTAGLVLAIEPIISAGSRYIQSADDGWTIRTSDGSLSAHFEHTVVVTAGEPIVLTAL